MVRAGGAVARMLAGLALLVCIGRPALAAPMDATMGLPMVINASHSARPGDIVGFQGENFGDTPVAMLQGPDGGAAVALEPVSSYGGIWAAFRLPASANAALVVRIGNGAEWSTPIKLNAATPMHLDALQLAARGRFRLFGRNLLLPGSSPVLTVDGWPAQVDLAASNEHMLVAIAPAQLRNKARVELWVDNGNGSGASLLERPLSSVAGDGSDPFSLGVGWAQAFSGIAEKVLLAHSDARLRHPLRCDGSHDDSQGLQEAILLAHAIGGAVVQLPPGNCRLTTSVQLQSNVVLQGAGKARTVISYETSYPLLGRGISQAGLRDFSLRNVAGAIESALLQNSERVFFQNVAFEINGGVQMFLDGNLHIAIDRCDFIQPKNPREHGPFSLAAAGGLVFTHNRVVFANGSPAFGRVHDAYISDNHISRDATDNQNSKGIIHSLTLDFAHRVAVLNNVLDVIGGPIVNKRRNDGETLLSEGGGGHRTENVGYVKTATPLTLTDLDVGHIVRPFGPGEIPENYALAIVGGPGAGQARRVMAYSDRTFTVDRAWDIVPDSSSRYATFVWGLEKSLIKGNTLAQNPRGIWLYQTALRDIDIVSNTIREGGGIYLRTAQNLKERLFTPMYGVRVAGNTIANSSGEWPSYIHLAFVRMDEPAFGLAAIGVDIRDNILRANRANVFLAEEESGGVEGFVARARFEGESQARSKNQVRLLGTIFQNNVCHGCAIGTVIREGAAGTVQDGNSNVSIDAQSP